MAKQRKNFMNFKTSYNEQYLQKKKDLNLLFSIKKEKEEKKKQEEDCDDDDDNKYNDNDTIDLELSNQSTIKVKRALLRKFSNSTLAACFNGQVQLPQRNGKYFIDREELGFTLMLNFLKTSKIPKFNDEQEEQAFFDEINYWKINIPINKNNLKFDMNWCPNFFVVDKTQKCLSSTDVLTGIVFLDRVITASNPYFEFHVVLAKFNSPNKKIILALVDPLKFKKNYLFSSFESGAPFHFYWDPIHNKAAKINSDGDGTRVFDIGKTCCNKNNSSEMLLGLYYNQEKKSLQLYRDGNNLGVCIEGIKSGLTPAIEIRMEDTRITLNNASEPPEKFFL